MFFITRTLKQDLAEAFSTTSLTELEQNYSSGRVMFFCGNSKVFLFCISILSADKASKKIFRKQGSGNIKVYAPKFPCQGFSEFVWNIHSDIDFQLAISISPTRNSRSFTELTDRLAFVNFSSPASTPLPSHSYTGPLYPGHSIWKAEPICLLSLPYYSLKNSTHSVLGWQFLPVIGWPAQIQTWCDLQQRCASLTIKLQCLSKTIAQTI